MLSNQTYQNQDEEGNMLPILHPNSVKLALVDEAGTN
jgi:hypothetical protein